MSSLYEEFQILVEFGAFEVCEELLALEEKIHMIHTIHIRSFEGGDYKTLVFVAYRIDCTENMEYFENKDLFKGKEIVLITSEVSPA